MESRAVTTVTYFLRVQIYESSLLREGNLPNVNPTEDCQVFMKKGTLKTQNESLLVYKVQLKWQME